MWCGVISFVKDCVGSFYFSNKLQGGNIPIVITEMIETVFCLYFLGGPRFRFENARWKFSYRRCVSQFRGGSQQSHTPCYGITLAVLQGAESATDWLGRVT